MLALVAICVLVCRTPLDASFCRRSALSPATKSIRSSASWRPPASALFIFVAGYLVYFCDRVSRAARRDAPDAIGVQIHDNHKLELWWTIDPDALRRAALRLERRIWYGIQVSQPQNGLVVEAIGHQWYYTFRYPQIHGEITDEMHLPVGVPVR